MNRPNAKSLTSLAAGVRGARSMGIETQDTRAAPAALAAAHAWMRADMPDGEHGGSVAFDAIDAAAWELARAMGVPALRFFRGELVEVAPSQSDPRGVL